MQHFYENDYSRKKNLYIVGEEKSSSTEDTVSVVYNQSPFFSSHLGLTKYRT